MFLFPQNLGKYKKVLYTHHSFEVRQGLWQSKTLQTYQIHFYPTVLYLPFSFLIWTYDTPMRKICFHLYFVINRVHDFHSSLFCYWTCMSSFIYTSEIGHLKNPVASTRITAKTNKTELMQLCMDWCDAVGLVWWEVPRGFMQVTMPVQQ